MKIDITKEQYKDLIGMLAIANSVVGILGDSVTDPDYKKRSNKMDELENYFIQFAKDFNCGGLAQKSEYKEGFILDDEYYENEIMPIMDDYDNMTTCNDLSNELAWRDFRRDHSEKELKEMEKKNGGYFGVPLYDYEKKYWDEFEKHGFERLVVKI